MKWMRADAAVEYLDNVISKRMLYSAVARGECKAARVGLGRALAFTDVWLNEYIERRATKTEPLEIRLVGDEPDTALAARRIG